MAISPPIKVALFDVCNTLVDRDTLSEFTEHWLVSRSHNPQWRFRTWLHHYIWRFLRGKTYILNSHSGRKHDVYLLAGYSHVELEGLIQRYGGHLKTHLKTSIVEELHQLKREGYLLFFVSAGLDLYLKPLADYLGAGLICTVAEVNTQGFYTGAIEGIDCIGEGKVLKIKQEMSLFNSIDWKDSIAYGDSESDIPMLSLTGSSVVVDPDTKLLQEARARNWRVIMTR